jgi:hypothetical protein
MTDEVAGDKGGPHGCRVKSLGVAAEHGSGRQSLAPLPGVAPLSVRVRACSCGGCWRRWLRRRVSGSMVASFFAGGGQPDVPDVRC